MILSPGAGDVDVSAVGSGVFGVGVDSNGAVARAATVRARGAHEGVERLDLKFACIILSVKRLLIEIDGEDTERLQTLRLT